jgi:doubled CXXCH motif protein
MRSRFGIAAVAMLLLCVLIAPAAMAGKTRAVGISSGAQLQIVSSAAQHLQQKYSAAELQIPVYVGSDFCVACHQTMSTQKATNHASFVRRPLKQFSLVAGKGVIADYDNNKVEDFVQGLDFNKIDGPFNAYKPNAPILSVEGEQYFVTIGSLKMPLLLTVAGQRNGSAQRFVVRVPVTDTTTKLTTSAYFAPIQYTPGTGWAAYSPNGWYDATTKAPKFAAGIGSAALVATGGPSNHTSGCTGCHTGAFKPLAKTASGETQFTGYTAIVYANNDPSVIDYDNDGEMELMNIGCEACHGAGSLHILGGGDPNMIVNPKKLTQTQQAEICGRCHVTSKSIPNGTYNWPMNDATGELWTPFVAKFGTPLANFYTDAANYFPDGVHPNGGRPYNAYKTSAHATFAAHTVGCPECHDPHEEGEGMLIRESFVQSGVTIKTSAEDNSLCVGCHAGYGPFSTLKKQDVADMQAGNAEAFDKIARVTESHTHHPYAPERMMGLSRCTGCHMSVGHNFDAISPEQTLKYQDKGGMANSCASGCHNSKVDVFNLGVKGTASGWANTFDVKLSNALKTYFGEGGTWWDTKK